MKYSFHHKRTERTGKIDYTMRLVETFHEAVSWIKYVFVISKIMRFGKRKFGPLILSNEAAQDLNFGSTSVFHSLRRSRKLHREDPRVWYSSSRHCISPSKMPFSPEGYAEKMHVPQLIFAQARASFMLANRKYARLCVATLLRELYQSCRGFAVFARYLVSRNALR